MYIFTVAKNAPKSSSVARSIALDPTKRAYKALPRSVAGFQRCRVEREERRKLAAMRSEATHGGTLQLR